MSRLISENEMSTRVARGELIEYASTSSIEGVKYDFLLGPDVLLPGGGPLHADSSGESQGRRLLLMPGSLAYVLTKERLKLPKDVKAELSPKRKMSHAGILVLGGFCVDPGYTGRLLFALFNYSTSPFLLRPGKKLIAAQFYQLDSEETPPVHIQEPIEDFPDDIVRFMTTYEPVTVDGLNTKLEQLRARIDSVAVDVSSREDWFKRIQETYERHDQQIGQLTHNLEEEHKNRKEAEAEFRQEMRELNKETVRTTLKTGFLYSLTLALIVAALSGFMGWWLRGGQTTAKPQPSSTTQGTPVPRR
jgi:hypothetical protein